MTDTTENSTKTSVPNSTPPAPPSTMSQIYQDIKGDYYTLLNNGIYNFGALYVFYKKRFRSKII